MEMIQFVVTCLKTYYPGLIGKHINTSKLKLGFTI